MFKTNEGKADRILRGVVGVVALVLFVMLQGTTLGWVFLAVGVIALFTAITGFCAIYRLFGVSTCKISQS